MSTNIVILTRNSLRHEYIRKTFGLADEINVLRSYCETSGSDLLVEARERGEPVRIDHPERRNRSEYDRPLTHISKPPRQEASSYPVFR